jgi:hypothetical protein
VSTRAIRTSIAHSACDVCGRTLLRGERAEVYLSGGTRHSVCELCTSRALHGGWIREGTVPEYDESSARLDRRRSLLGRWRGRREVDAEPDPDSLPLEEDGQESSAPGRFELAGEEPTAPPVRPPARPSARPASRQTARAAGRARDRDRDRDRANAAETRQREPRHVRAVPTSIENKTSSAVSLFNGSEHPRTVAGIARSLGLPEVSVRPSDTLASMVNVVVTWELCWYRYEVDLSDEVPTVRVAGQGYELDELSAQELQINATADDRGMLDLSS